MDPSADRMRSSNREEIARNPAVKLLIFSRRFGQPAATIAGDFEYKRRGVLCHRR